MATQTSILIKILCYGVPLMLSDCKIKHIHMGWRLYLPWIAQKYCKKRGYVLAGARIVDRDARNPKDGTFLMADGKNEQGSEELTCIPLHIVNAKESHASLFMTDFKSFFDFGNRCLNVGLVPRIHVEPTFIPFKLCTFPMDISTEDTCLNSGGGYKVKDFFCTKCVCRTSKLHHFWDNNNERLACIICEEVWEDGGGDTPDRYWHYYIDDKEEIIYKRGVLSDMLVGKDLHLE